jgi:hypothetical protein
MNIAQWIALHLGSRAGYASFYSEDQVVANPDLSRMNTTIFLQWRPAKVERSLPLIAWIDLPAVIKSAIQIRLEG